MWRVAVGPACIGSASCVALSPALFALGEDKRSHPVRAEIEPDGAALDAAFACPVEAITVTDQETGRVVSE
ncbi:MAG: ferredoxin [Micromonosporaceae bacterium]|nr:ferredoxin [Micromonosporaceae bacterium]